MTEQQQQRLFVIGSDVLRSAFWACVGAALHAGVMNTEMALIAVMFAAFSWGSQP